MPMGWCMRSPPGSGAPWAAQIFVFKSPSAAGFRLQRKWDCHQKVTVNVTDKLITLLMLILSTVFTYVSYIMPKHLTTSIMLIKTIILT